MILSLIIHISKSNPLPIFKYKKKLQEVVANTTVTIVFGNTGSGKSTQLTQIIYDNNVFRGLICCTQPRRIAAISLAMRVSKERNSLIGDLVGYAVRFEENISEKTSIKYITDGLLIKDSFIDPVLKNYFCVILDEAHERTINTDLLLGICKKIINIRPDFKLIVTSATLELKKFSYYFNKCPIFIIPGKLFIVNIFYLKHFQTNYLLSTFNTIIKILENTKKGHILVFLTGKNEIDFISDILYIHIRKANKKTNLSIFPLFSNIGIEKQIKIFQNSPQYLRKCILSTNIAETSLTIPGIKFVIDNGYCKTKFFDVKHKIEILSIIPISKSSANQRSGRAGRIGKGKCFRLYTETIYKNEMTKNLIPEIKRIKLTDMVLILKSFGYTNINDFDFFENPYPKTINFALEELYKLKAIKKNGMISNLGTILSYFPIDVKMGKSLITSVSLKCLIEVVIIISLLSENHNLLDLGTTKKLSCFEKFKSSLGDHLTLLQIYKSWIKKQYSPKWCRQYGISSFGLFQARKISKQLLNILKQFRISIICPHSSKIKICKSFSSGYFLNSAKKIQHGLYQVSKSICNYKIFSFYSNVIEYPKWIIFHEIRKYGKEFLYIICITKLKWLLNYLII
ncbi:splicing factor Prp22 (nucleomorph) [Lotharella oceanica]|uniref:Splicing factor Prp22 n=1 Tax=Lotharella oceanica TaxID=641309 RepID=A0A060D6F7_9EUKA|nr:splicing factor Prp22 [Lotharella oceanica]